MTDVQLKNKETVYDAMAIILMALFAFFINREISISGLYMDDLYLWSCYGEQSFTEFVFPVGSARFRPVFWTAAYMELRAIGTNLQLIVPINLVILTLITVYCYFFMKRLSGSGLLAFSSCIAILASTFSYYDVSQLLGLLESLSMFFAVFICIELYRYMHEGKELHFIPAVISYLLVCFTHERYMVIIPMFYYALIIKKDRKRVNYIFPAAAFLFVVASRYLITGTILPAGTGGTKVEETFTIAGFIGSIKCEIKYLLGFNAGPEYLCGIEWQYVNSGIKACVYCGIALMTLIALLFFVKLIKKIGKGAGRLTYLTDEMLFAGFIIGCVAASSVTIRVEMRWIYTSFVFMLFIIAYAYGVIAKNSGKGLKRTALLCSVMICLLFICENCYYRGFWNRIYLFPNQARYNSLADVTYGKYGDEIFGKDIYIIGNSYEMSDFTGETFFKTFDPERKAEGTKVYHVEDIGDIRRNENCIVLKEDPENNAFTEIRQQAPGNSHSKSIQNAQQRNGTNFCYP